MEIKTFGGDVLRDGFIKPEEVLPRALKVIDSGHVKEIYNDGY